jgi:hypothetical protein
MAEPYRRDYFGDVHERAARPPERMLDGEELAPIF